MQKDIATVLNLSKEHQVVFAALTCEKLLYIIIEYDKYELNKGERFYRKCVDTLYSFALGNHEKEDIYTDLKAGIETLCPDLDESKNPFASYGLDAYVALIEAFLFLLRGSTKHILNCSTFATDIVDMYVQMVSEEEPSFMPNLDAFISSSSYMIQEVNRQNTIAKALVETDLLNLHSIESLRKLNGRVDIVDLSCLLRR